MRWYAAAPASSPQVKAGDYELDLSRKELTIAGEVTVLTSFEYLILEYLMRNARQVVSKQQLLDQLYGDGEGDPNTIEVMVSRLRKNWIRKGASSPSPPSAARATSSTSPVADAPCHVASPSPDPPLPAPQADAECHAGHRAHRPSPSTSFTSAMPRSRPESQCPHAGEPLQAVLVQAAGAPPMTDLGKLTPDAIDPNLDTLICRADGR